MIETVVIDLPSDEEKQLRSWLNAPATKTFLKILGHRTKRLQIEAMNAAQQGSEQYRNSASDTLRQSMESERFEKLLQDYISETEKLTILKIH